MIGGIFIFQGERPPFLKVLKYLHTDQKESDWTTVDGASEMFQFTTE